MTSSTGCKRGEVYFLSHGVSVVSQNRCVTPLGAGCWVHAAGPLGTGPRALRRC
jgi:hypothetical protein